MPTPGQVTSSTGGAAPSGSPAPWVAVGSNGQLVVDGHFVVIRRSGLRALLNHGFKGDKRIPIGSITSVQFRPAGLMLGYIQFSLGGSIEGRRGHFEAGMDENTVQFHASSQPAFEAARAYIEQYLVQRAGGAAPTRPPGLADELKSLTTLWEAGALSDDEFAEAKRRLLS